MISWALFSLYLIFRIFVLDQKRIIYVLKEPRSNVCNKSLKVGYAHHNGHIYGDKYVE